MQSLLNRSIGLLLGLSLLSFSYSSPAAQQDSDVHPPLAWLVNQDDHPLVSRRLVMSSGVDGEVQTVLEPLLYCFDAADHQRLMRAGERLILSGQVSNSRSAPNVSMPLQLLDVDSGDLQLLQGNSAFFAVSPDGTLLLEWNHFQLDVWRLPQADGSRAEVIRRLDINELGNAQVSTALWMPQSDSFLVQISNYKDLGLEPGIWEFPLEGEPLFLGFLFGRMLCVLDSQTLLHSIPNPRDKYHARRLMRSHFHLSSMLPGEFRSEELHHDLMYTDAIAARPNSADFAYARASDKSLVLHSEQDGAVKETVMWQSSRSIEDLSWSADGRWLCLTDRTAERQRHIIVINCDTGDTQDLGPGLRPIFL